MIQNLHRFPASGNRSLQAWDAADELLLSHIAALELPETARVLIINDGFGALACNLHAWTPYWHNDSLLSAEALTRNLDHNGLARSAVQLLPSLDDPSAPPDYDLIVIKVPQQLAYLEYLLHTIRPRLHSTTQLVLAGMTRRIHHSTFELCSTVIGPASSSLAVKKARLIFVAHSNPAADSTPLPTSSPAWSPAIIEEWDGLDLVKLPNTFARSHIDVGSRVLARYLGAPDESARHPEQVLDIGCGNGFLCLAAAQSFPDAQIIGIDESHLAVESARQSFERNRHRHSWPSLQKARFRVMDGGNLQFDPPLPQRYDLILVNPPFHEQGAVDRTLAMRLIRHAAAWLSPQGRMLIVANASLGYQGILRRHFPQVEIVDRAQGFMVLRLRGADRPRL